MLTLNMAGLSESELEKIVAERCSVFGTIANVRVVRPARPAGYAIALVRMATASTLDSMIVHIGATKSRSTAIIRLVQEKKSRARHA